MDNPIVVAIDGSQTSITALKEAILLAQSRKLGIVIVNVQPTFDTIHTRMFINKDVIHDYQKELAEEATKEALQVLQESNVEYDNILRYGNPKHEICQLAKERKASYIVMGSRGMGAAKGSILGSVSYGVLHEAVCPVLIVPEKHS